MGSTIDSLKNSLGFGNQINELKNNQTPEVDSISELYTLILSGDTRITNLETNTGTTNTRLSNLESNTGTTNTRITH